MSGTKISQLPGAITPSATDLFPIVQSDVGPITRAITLAALRLAIFTNNTQSTFGLNNTSTATNETAGFTVDIGGARRSNITAQRIGVTSEARLGFSISDTAGVMQEIVSIGLAQTISNRPLRVLADNANITLALNGKATSNDASIRFYNNAGDAEQARVVAGPNLLSLSVGANTPLTMSSTQINLLTTTVAATPTVDTNTTQVATTAFVVGQAGSAAPLVNGTATVGTSLRYAREGHVHPTDTTRAPLTSPTFAGVPAAPTAAVNTNTTQVATTAFVVGQASTVAPLIDGVATVGTSLRYAREDHVHPTDTTRLAASATTAFSLTLLDDTSAAAARTTLGAPPVPITGQSAGQWAQHGSADGANLILPAGGTWTYTFDNYTTSNVFTGTKIAGVAAGGTTLVTGVAAFYFTGFVWRIA